MFKALNRKPQAASRRTTTMATQRADVKQKKGKAPPVVPTLSGQFNWKRVPVSALNAAPYNPRRDLKPGDPEFEALRGSLNAFGYVEPIVWNEKTGRVVGGHQRLKVLLAGGASEVDVSVVFLDDEREKALNIALNKVGGGWDDALLATLLAELKESESLSLSGFTEAEIEELEAGLRGAEGEDEDPAAGDDTGEPADTVRVSVGHVQWTEPRAKYEKWAKELKEECGNDRAAMVKRMRERLGLVRKRQ